MRLSTSIHCPKYDCEEVPDQVNKSVSVKNLSAHFTLHILANQDLKQKITANSIEENCS